MHRSIPNAVVNGASRPGIGAAINLRVWTNGKPPTVVDHDHRHCRGDVSCGQCVRGLAHPRCNQLSGQVEALVTIIGHRRLAQVVARFLDLIDQDSPDPPRHIPPARPGCPESRRYGRFRG